MYGARTGGHFNNVLIYPELQPSGKPYSSDDPQGIRSDRTFRRHRGPNKTLDQVWNPHTTKIFDFSCVYVEEEGVYREVSGEGIFEWCAEEEGSRFGRRLIWYKSR